MKEWMATFIGLIVITQKRSVEAYSRTIFTQYDKYFIVSIVVNKIKDIKIKSPMHEKKGERDYRKHSSLLYALHKFIMDDK
jgi:hypothetical protein